MIFSTVKTLELCVEHLLVKLQSELIKAFNKQLAKFD